MNSAGLKIANFENREIRSESQKLQPVRRVIIVNIMRHGSLRAGDGQVR